MYLCNRLLLSKQDKERTDSLADPIALHDPDSTQPCLCCRKKQFQTFLNVFLSANYGFLYYIFMTWGNTWLVLINNLNKKYKICSLG